MELFPFTVPAQRDTHMGCKGLDLRVAHFPVAAWLRHGFLWLPPVALCVALSVVAAWLAVSSHGFPGHWISAWHLFRWPLGSLWLPRASPSLALCVALFPVAAWLPMASYGFPPQLALVVALSGGRLASCGFAPPLALVGALFWWPLGFLRVPIGVQWLPPLTGPGWRAFLHA